MGFDISVRTHGQVALPLIEMKEKNNVDNIQQNLPPDVKALICKELLLVRPGRTTPDNLMEQMAMYQVQSNPLNGAKDLSNKLEMADKRWPKEEGWIKMSNNVNGIEIHFVYNTKTREFDDFKFK